MQQWAARERRADTKHINHHHGSVNETARARRDFRAVPVVHRGRAPASVPSVPAIHHVLLRVRVVLRAVHIGPERRRPPRVEKSRFQLVVEMRFRLELGKYSSVRHDD